MEDHSQKGRERQERGFDLADGNVMHVLYSGRFFAKATWKARLREG